MAKTTRQELTKARIMEALEESRPSSLTALARVALADQDTDAFDGDMAKLLELAPEAVEILRQRRKDVEADQRYVFASSSVRGHLYDIRLGLNRVLDRAKITEKVTPHDLRRTTATWMLGEGADIEIVARLLSHATFGVTSTYAKAGIELIRKNLERTVRAMLATLDDKDGKATVVDFPAATRSGQ